MGDVLLNQLQGHKDGGNEQHRLSLFVITPDAKGHYISIIPSVSPLLFLPEAVALDPASIIAS